MRIKYLLLIVIAMILAIYLFSNAQNIDDNEDCVKVCCITTKSYHCIDDCSMKHDPESAGPNAQQVFRQLNACMNRCFTKLEKCLTKKCGFTAKGVRVLVDKHRDMGYNIVCDCGRKSGSASAPCD